MDAVNDGTIDIKSYEMPSFLYDSETEYDPDARHIGLLRSEILVRVCVHLSFSYHTLKISPGVPSYFYWTWQCCYRNKQQRYESL
jgi:hypothetical protein